MDVKKGWSINDFNTERYKATASFKQNHEQKSFNVFLLEKPANDEIYAPRQKITPQIAQPNHLSISMSKKTLKPTTVYCTKF